MILCNIEGLASIFVIYGKTHKHLYNVHAVTHRVYAYFQYIIYLDIPPCTTPHPGD